MAASIYIVIGEVAGWIEPSAAQVKAGTLSGGLVWAGNEAAPTVSGVFDVASMATGLSPEVAYNASLVWSDGVTDSNVYTFEFTTLGPRVYIVVGKSSEWVLPSAAEVKAGTLSGGATWVGSAPAPELGSTIDLDTVARGLRPNTAYTAALVWTDGTEDSNVFIIEFRTAKKTGASPTAAAPSYEDDHARMLEREAQEEAEIMMIVATLVQRGVIHA